MTRTQTIVSQAIYLIIEYNARYRLLEPSIGRVMDFFLLYLICLKCYRVDRNLKKFRLEVLFVISFSIFW